MKIALIGYGKMGHIIEKIAKERGHEIVSIIDMHNPEDFDSDAFRSSDVAIEFTIPSVAAANVLKCFEAGVPVVSGTTAWTDRLPEMKHLCAEGKGTLLWASNFSIGVNIFMALNRYLTRMMNAFPQYTPHLVETHHIHKLDHPSGTAVTLAENLIEESDRISSWAEPEEGNTIGEDVLEIDHIRSGEVPGIHTIDWESEQDSISITHSAKSREGFAMGAVLAAEWLAGKSGFRTIGEMYSEIINSSK
ncbi:MAG: 4-hydroxy-tetrahydrodipicolinate reductase [Muribaculaceae bacterium]|nr:4-hydroxy-tetrahydrodipicolinate reductase [Muribaculaceae bacterium]